MPLLERAVKIVQKRVRNLRLMLMKKKYANVLLILCIHFRKLDCQKEFEDFTEESRQLEQELETTLIQNEKQLRDANQTIDSLRDENQSLRVSAEISHYITLFLSRMFSQIIILKINI